MKRKGEQEDLDPPEIPKKHISLFFREKMPSKNDQNKKNLKKQEGAKRSSTKKQTKRKSTKKQTKRKSQKGGSSLPSVAVSTINSMINLGKSIFDEMDAVMNMGKDFNKASNVQLPNQTTPDQAVTSQTQTMKYPTMPKATV